jgi:transcriptional regulator with XRE-family HTH domain
MENKLNAKDFAPAKRHVPVTTGEIIRILREKKGWTQEVLAKKCGISATNLSMLENDRVDIGKRRAEQIARAFKIHPALIMFPEYQVISVKRAA